MLRNIEYITCQWICLLGSSGRVLSSSCVRCISGARLSWLWLLDSSGVRRGILSSSGVGCISGWDHLSCWLWLLDISGVRQGVQQWCSPCKLHSSQLSADDAVGMAINTKGL